VHVRFAEICILAGVIGGMAARNGSTRADLIDQPATVGLFTASSAIMYICLFVVMSRGEAAQRVTRRSSLHEPEKKKAATLQDDASTKKVEILFDYCTYTKGGM
jgi:hypothetical protein